MLRLTDITIENFRGIATAKLSGLADVTVLVGRNNCGKTTVLEAVARVVRSCDSNSHFDPAQRAREEWFDQARRQTSNDDLRFRGRVDRGWRLALTLGPKEWEISSRSAPGRMLDEDREHIEFFTRSTVFRPPHALVSIEVQLWQRLLKTRRDRDLVKAVREIFGGDVEQLQVPGSQMFLLFPDYSVSIDVQGDGARAALRCLMVLITLGNGLLMLEEPECHQHPGSLERFARAVCQLAQQQGTQLLLTTHSLECVRAFRDASRDAGSSFALMHLRRPEDGEVSVTRINGEDLDSLVDAGTDPRWLDLYG